eukprot:scaffold213467_cov26-Prasinocladus_malaysianus.AAC.1
MDLTFRPRRSHFLAKLGVSTWKSSSPAEPGSRHDPPVQEQCLDSEGRGVSTGKAVSDGQPAAFGASRMSAWSTVAAMASQVVGMACPKPQLRVDAAEVDLDEAFNKPSHCP